MKRFTLFMALLVSWGWLVKPCLAQKLDQRIKNIYASLDKSEVQSGILIHQTPVFLWPGRYDGRNTADSMQLSLDQFGILYGQFRGASVGRAVLPEPSVYLSQRTKPQFKNDTVKLATMLMAYDFIKAGAYDNHLLEWSDGRMHDVPGRNASPYKQDTCFAFTALQQKFRGLKVQYLLTEELIYNNLNWEISRLQIDFDDGQGFRPVATNRPVSVHYPDAGNTVAGFS